MNVTRTTNPNGTYRYEIDGELQYKASKVLYTHVSTYTNGAVLFHKTEAAARKTTGYKYWTKAGYQAIVDGDAAPATPQGPQCAACGDATCTATDAHHTVTEFAARPAHIPADQWDAMSADERDAMVEWETKMGRTTQLDAAPVDAPQAPSCGNCAAHPGWAHGDTTRRVEPRDVCGVCLGSGTPVPPAKRRAPRNGTRVRVNTEYPGQAYKGMTGKVHSKVTGDDGVRYVMVDFQGRTWPFQIHELDVI